MARGRTEKKCLTCEQRVPLDDIADRVRDDFKYCPTCSTELLNWMRGYAEARPLKKWAWLNEEVARCYICGEGYTQKNPMNVEHVIARSRGGEDRMNNIGFACLSCNARKGTRTLEMDAEQSARLRRQQQASAERYAEMKPHIGPAFFQEVLLHFAADPEMEPEYDCDAELLALRVVEELHNVFRRYDNEDYPADYLPKDFVEKCVQYTRAYLDEIETRDWYESQPGPGAEALVREALADEGINPDTLEPPDYEEMARRAEAELAAIEDEPEVLVEDVGSFRIFGIEVKLEIVEEVNEDEESQ